MSHDFISSFRMMPSSTPPAYIEITVLNIVSVDLVKRSIAARVHEYASVYRPHCTVQLMPGDRHICFWGSATRFIVN